MTFAKRRRQLTDTVLSRLLGQAPVLNEYVTSSVRIPMRDSTVLLGDHFAPQTRTPRGTVLVRTPYGRGFPTSALNGRLLAARGYHVLVQSVRGTFGSGGTMQPMAQETADGQDTVAWLRRQRWFDGRLATLGGSYLGWTQWTLLQDPPPELRTAVVYVGPHDFFSAVYGTGAFTLGDFLGWTYQITRQEDGGGLRRAVTAAMAGRRLRRAYAGLPLPEAAETVLNGRAPWYSEWVAHPDPGDAWWTPYRAGSALERLNVPLLLVSGWQDLFLEQTLTQYAALRDRGVEVALTVGPWTHLEVGTRAAAQLSQETVAWFDQHLAGGPAARKAPVQVFRTGERRWHRMASWPPATDPAVFGLHAQGVLTLINLSDTPAEPDPAALRHNPADPDALSSLHKAAEPDTVTSRPNPTEPDTGTSWHNSAEPDTVDFRYDPADPTPTLGGRTLTGSMGMKDNRPLEVRPDVLSFTTDPLPTAVDVIGSPVLHLAISVDHPYADVFVRLCDVDERGRSRNFSDMMRRLDPGVPAGEIQHVTLTLDPCFHRLLAGHRLRLLVTGGAFPRYARALDPDGNLTPSRRTIHCAASRLTLPVAASPSAPPELP